LLKKRSTFAFGGMEEAMVTVKVPATSANIGSGFDSMGVALQIYNTITAEETDDGLRIDILDETRDFLPRDNRNLVYRAMQKVFDEVGYVAKGIHITQDNKIPVTRGLGSSSASIVGGLIAANRICGNVLSTEEIMMLAAQLEGHPDNTTPAITGGMAIAVMADKIYHISLPIDENKLRFAVFIPDFILRTKRARRVLPRTVPHSDAVFNTGRAALLAASIITERYDNLKIALDDRLHQPYRKGLISGVDIIFNKSNEYGALGSYISGAGPSIIAIIKAEQEQDFYIKMNSFLSCEMHKWKLQIVKPDNKGVKIIEGGQEL